MISLRSSVKSFAFTGLLLTATLVTAQQNHSTIKLEPIPPTAANSGKAMFLAYCAVCHGADGKGAGPAASALKVAPADLTTLSSRNGGKYPATQVVSAIKFGPQAPKAHGSKDMPIWGPLFGSLSNNAASPEITQRISNLSGYIRTLQR